MPKKISRNLQGPCYCKQVKSSLVEVKLRRVLFACQLFSKVKICSLYSIFCNCYLYAQGYVIYSIRKKLRKQYMNLKGKQIEKLKKSGVEVCQLNTVSFYRLIFAMFFYIHLYLKLFSDHRYYLVPWGRLHWRHNIWFFSWSTQCWCFEGKDPDNWG